jgi:DNA-binding NtrC family response regulator
MRLLVLDENQLLAWMVERVAPPGTEVVGFTSFDDACREMTSSPPDAAIVSLTGAHLPWSDFRRRCTGHRPPVPVLFESCVFASAEEAGLTSDGEDVRFLRTPASRAELHEAIVRLLSDTREVRERPDSEGISP